jgi:two-component system nitrogen regulation response regulator GlnG
VSHILIVDDEPAICWALRECLTDEGYTVDTAGSAEQGLESAGLRPPDVVLLDVRLPGMDGLTALPEFHGGDSAVPVIVMTAFGSLSTAVQAIDQGAFDYLTKPLELDHVLTVVRQAELVRQAESVARRTNSNDGSATLTHSEESDQFGGCDELITGRTPVMQEIYRRIALVADHDVPVLITGESGTGKDLVARAIHQHSGRRGSFVPICVPAMSDTVIESELFGHVRGAFTGADSARTGLLQSADQGTAFIDEIGDVSLGLQVKLLRVLETKEIQPVGTGKCVSSAFRLIAATNQNLEEIVSRGSFREDLYFRLNVFRIHLPPLRERRSDIPLLAERFLRDSSPSGSRRLSQEALSELCERPWYGNVRELRNAIDAASVVCRGNIIQREHLPPCCAEMRQAESSVSETTLGESITSWISQQLARQNADDQSPRNLLESFLDEAEPVLFQQVLSLTGGNRAHAAKLLGIHRETLREKLRRYGMDE